ncbi:metal ABC transporter permease, partial [Escherichia coli]|nr:metal ABC transporter permease [Escherichia coli]
MSPIVNRAVRLLQWSWDCGAESSGRCQGLFLKAFQFFFPGEKGRCDIPPCLVAWGRCITARLLPDLFPRLLMIAVAIGSVTSYIGAWVSFFLEGEKGVSVVVAQIR